MKAMQDIRLSDVQAVMNTKKYKVYNDQNPNIVGIRNSQCDAIDYLDICWVWWTINGNLEWHFYTITTVPGLYFLKKPLLPNGCAILVPNQYLDSWVLGTMNDTGQYALIESGNLSVYRDNTRDGILHCDSSTIQGPDNFAIDLHHGSSTNTPLIGQNSAGCQVWQYADAHEALMQEFTNLQNNYGVAKFSYTLLNQEDFV